MPTSKPPVTSRIGPPTKTANRRKPPSSLAGQRSEEHTSELQSLAYLVCRLLLEKKKTSNESRTDFENRAPPEMDRFFHEASEDRLTSRTACGLRRSSTAGRASGRPRDFLTPCHV